MLAMEPGIQEAVLRIMMIWNSRNNPSVYLVDDDVPVYERSEEENKKKSTYST